ncbi:MAG: anthranilate synthase component I [Chloroflexota bacterium]|nr:anthranilate synthase component I [Chloroflexota bacterium]
MVHIATPRHRTRRRGELTPSFTEVQALVERGNSSIHTIPVYREIMADLETPVSAYLKICGQGRGFLLESVEGGERLARYSFIGADPLIVVTLRDGIATIEGRTATREERYTDPLVALGDLLAPYQGATLPGLPRFVGGAVGYLGYEAVRSFEPRVAPAAGPGLGLPDGRFLVVDSLLVFDHLERTIKAVSHVHLHSGGSLEEAYAAAAARVDSLVAQLRRPTPPLPIGEAPVETAPAERQQPNTTPERYRAMVERAKEYITAGDVIQVVLSQRVDLPTPAHPFTVYRALRTVNPSPYMFYLEFLDHQIVGASPELLVRLEDRTITNHPIAGTRPRGETADADSALAAELAADEKERAEHIMLVDLGRNDVGRVAQPGSVRVPQLMEVERYSHVMHLVSHVEGELEDGLSGLDALRSCFPAGTVSGAPKVRAMEIIAELETDRRGAYSGAVGYVDFAGGMDTAIALRTLVVKEGVASMQAGGGIVADSTPEGEYAESYHKMRALLRAIELAEDLEAAEYDLSKVTAGDGGRDQTQGGAR